jgi:hypothetical protein
VWSDPVVFAKTWVDEAYNVVAQQPAIVVELADGFTNNVVFGIKELLLGVEEFIVLID